MWSCLPLSKLIKPRHLVCLIVTAFAGCGGSSHPPVIITPPAVRPAVLVSPLTATVPISTNELFSAFVTHSSSNVVKWSVSAGTVDDTGFYVAPDSVPSGGTATISATLASDPSVKGSAVVTITTKPVTLTVSPTTATVKAGFATYFAPTVTGTSNLEVLWSLNDPGDGGYPGSISGGVYWAPSPVLLPRTYSITATSAADPSKTASAQVSVIPLENQAAQTFPIELGASGLNSKSIDCCSGTLGSLLADQKGKQYILSNSHVAARMGSAMPGEAIIHPGFVDTECDFTVPKEVAKFTAAGGISSNVDAAISEVVAGAVDPKGGIIGLGGVKADGTYLVAPPATTIATATIGMRAAKSGRTTGLTCGTVEAVNASIQVDVPAECGIPAATSIFYQGQIVLDGLTRPGDSGSLIVEAATARPLALVTSGSSDGRFTGANPVGDVIQALNQAANLKLSFVGGGEHNVSCTAATGALPALHQPSTSPEFLLPEQEVERAMALQFKYENEILQNPGVLGVAVGREEANPGKVALVVFVEREGKPPLLPKTLGGLSVRMIPTGHFGPGVSAHTPGTPRLRMGLCSDRFSDTHKWTKSLRQTGRFQFYKND